MKEQTHRNRYITVCPSAEETEYIHLEYEQDRKRRVLDGQRPLSLSRFLITRILESLGDSIQREAV